TKRYTQAGAMKYCDFKGALSDISLANSDMFFY
ncbi:unnamed protein product, partial [marine sediment metagenome]